PGTRRRRVERAQQGAAGQSKRQRRGDRIGGEGSAVPARGREQEREAREVGEEIRRGAQAPAGQRRAAVQEVLAEDVGVKVVAGQLRGKPPRGQRQHLQ